MRAPQRIRRDHPDTGRTSWERVARDTRGWDARRAAFPHHHQYVAQPVQHPYTPQPQRVVTAPPPPPPMPERSRCQIAGLGGTPATHGITPSFSTREGVVDNSEFV